MKKMFNNSFGFTLVDVTATIAVLSIVSSLALPQLTGVLDKAKDTVCLAQRAIVEHVEAYYFAEHEYLKNASIDELYIQGYINKLPKCPAGGKYYWIKDNPPLLGCSEHFHPPNAIKK